MPKYRVTLYVQVVVEANSPQQAEDIALKNGKELARSADAHVTAAINAIKA